MTQLAIADRVKETSITTGAGDFTLSGLASGSALAHLLAVTQGTGTDRMIFVSQFSVAISEPQLFAVQRPKREANAERIPVARQTSDEKRKDVSVFTCDAALFLLTERDELFIRQGGTESVVVQDLGQAHFTVRQSDVIEVGH